MSASFQNILNIRVPLLELPHNGLMHHSIPLLSTVLYVVTHECRECSQYSHLPVGNPELKTV